MIDAPEVAVITNIGLEHTEYLGNTLEGIAATKAGMTNPVKGASAVYMVQVDSKAPAEGMSADMMRMQLEQGYRSKARMASQVLREQAKIVDQRNKFF